MRYAHATRTAMSQCATRTLREQRSAVSLSATRTLREQLSVVSSERSPLGGALRGGLSQRWLRAGK
ncbi:MAG: hypothetical protein F6K55_25740 [Moorea sp. SIO4A3]|nr:hypothetical protein [Moorena sp. SIO4A3]NEQ87654.1 hypothetical protein [Moorena sp. SIO2I5]